MGTTEQVIVTVANIASVRTIASAADRPAQSAASRSWHGNPNTLTRGHSGRCISAYNPVFLTPDQPVAITSRPCARSQPRRTRYHQRRADRHARGSDRGGVCNLTERNGLPHRAHYVPAGIHKRQRVGDVVPLRHHERRLPRRPLSQAVMPPR